VHPPPELALALSGPAYVAGGLHESIPEVASVPLQLIPTGWLYQFLWSGPRAGVTFDAVGRVASYESVKPRGVETFPAPSMHVPLVLSPATSGPLYVREVHEAIPEVASVLSS
jgi:hypothetical protein